MSENPKAIAAKSKPTVHCVPPGFERGVGAVMKTGADKYGRFNWRQDPIKMTSYWDAIRRHLEAWTDGEDFDPETGLHHLYHVAASCAVVTDAIAYDTAIDDRVEQAHELLEWAEVKEAIVK